MKLNPLISRMMAVAFGLVWVSGHALAQEIVLSVADLYPTKHIVSTQGASFWMKRATELSGGKIEFKYFPAQQMAKADGILDAIRTGVVDSGSICAAYVSDKLPLNGVTMLPGLSGSALEGSSAYWKSLQSGMLRDELAANGVLPVFAYLFPAYQVISASKALRNIEDYRGMKLRTAGASMNLTAQSLGSSPISMPAPDMYLALERNTIDGTFLAFLSATAYNLQDIVQYASLNGSFGNSPCVYAINAKKFAELPPDIKDALVKAGQDTVKHLGIALDDANDRARETLEKAGVKLYSFSNAELASINEALNAVINNWFERMDRRKLPAREVLKEFKDALSSVQP